MYRFWEPVIEPLFGLLEPKVVVEIGSDFGLNTSNLIDYCRREGGTVHVVDPLPKYDADEWVAKYPEILVFHRKLSLEALGEIDGPDVVLIDGDHNWYTVYHELKTLERGAGGEESLFPVVLLHDIGWPYGRRDLYYDPAQIPPADTQPYEQAGMRPGREDLDPDGGLNPHLTNAVREGGERNGVLTAVEDFLAETPLSLRFASVPAINGLGILYSSSLTSDRPEFQGFVDGLADPQRLRDVLARVERFRVEAQIEAGDSQRALTQKRSELRAAEDALREARRQSSAERDRLEAQLSEVRSRTSDLEAALERERSKLQQGETELEGLTGKLEDAEIALERAEAKSRDLSKRSASLKKKLAASDERYRRLRSRKSVRAALAIASLARPILRPSSGVKGTTRESSNPSGGMTGGNRNEARGHSGKQKTERDKERLAREISRQRPGSPRVDGPMVSILVLTRNGAHHLQRLLPRLEETTYRSFELIVVDNGSTDATSAVLEERRSFPLEVIGNDHNVSFSQGNNQAALRAHGDYLLLLNNDIEPINPGWLGALVDSLERDPEAVACGALLVYPVRGDSGTDLTVQHAGTRYTFMSRGVRAVNVPAPDPLDPSLAGVFEVPTATAAALLVERDAYQGVGGLSEGYVYGTEDVDLCLKLKDKGGRILMSGDAVLFHHESATQDVIASEVTRINRFGNRQLLMETWGPRLTRSVQLDRFAEGHRWALNRPRTVAITLTHDDESKGWGDYYTAHELGDAFSRVGWNVVYAERFEEHWYDLTHEVDLLISLLDSYDVRLAPEGAVTIAWVRNWVDRWLEQPWFDKFDLVATSSHMAAQMIADRSRFAPMIIPLATNVSRFRPGAPNPTFECDYAFTGNNWGHGRDLIPLLDVRPGEKFMMFGKDWDKDPRTERYWRGHLEFELLPDLYRSSKIILDDTASPTLPYGFLNGRVFEALAAGALVITDNVRGSAEMFDGELPTYSNREELREKLDHYLGNEHDRLELVSKLRERVLDRHSYVARPDEFSDLAMRHLQRTKIAVKIGVPNEEVKPTWGDTHFANALASGLTKMGFPTAVHILPEWDLPENQAADVVIHLRGLTSYTPKPAHVNVLWIISHPDDVSAKECEKYDLVLVASKSHARWLQERVETPVVFMPQATDSRRFKPSERREDLATEVLFVGNSRGQSRPVVEWAVASGLPLTVYGSGWEGRIPGAYVRGEYFPNEQLTSLYASAKVVLNDHWPDMRDRGFISNRIYDALAAGSVVVSDPVEGLRDTFGDLVPTFDTAEELEKTVRSLLEDDNLRLELARKAAQEMTEHHTFTQRAQELVRLLTPYLEDRPRDVEGSPLFAALDPL